MSEIEQVVKDAKLKPFEKALEESELYPLKAKGIDVFQLNVGRLCNQACKHCHVKASPDSTEVMEKSTFDLCLEVLQKTDIPKVDITGGAPEMNPHFQWFVQECSRLKRHVMVRCNLTIILEPDYEYLPKFYREHRVEVIASLPFYTERNVDIQRGAGTFMKSIQALQMLNEVGYGKDDSGLILNLVYNPAGAFLPPPQHAIEADFKRELARRYDITFNQLYTITNMPIGRFCNFLIRTGNYDSYMQRLIDAYNPNAAEAVMCRYTLSVGWDGTLYDCDFNQMLNMSCNHSAPKHLREFNLNKLESREIITGLHCYGCTAGAGSSCGGAVVE
jgi:radical SAM/Cys-rich protein